MVLLTLDEALDKYLLEDVDRESVRKYLERNFEDRVHALANTTPWRHLTRCFNALRAELIRKSMIEAFSDSTDNLPWPDRTDIAIVALLHSTRHNKATTELPPTVARKLETLNLLDIVNPNGQRQYKEWPVAIIHRVDNTALSQQEFQARLWAEGDNSRDTATQSDKAFGAHLGAQSTGTMLAGSNNLKRPYNEEQPDPDVLLLNERPCQRLRLSSTRSPEQNVIKQQPTVLQPPTREATTQQLSEITTQQSTTPVVKKTQRSTVESLVQRVAPSSFIVQQQFSSTSVANTEISMLLRNLRLWHMLYPVYESLFANRAAAFVQTWENVCHGEAPDVYEFDIEQQVYRINNKTYSLQTVFGQILLEHGWLKGCVLTGVA
ncbi:hypothetical protein VTK73DRAFT_1562 [Phialemonium thermophilum]|uniref:Uncharacterized protein n=1 Tax=Phialemonium thermophilum TaxID=223376 RepID=A0ABR3X8P0_9PEZI